MKQQIQMLTESQKDIMELLKHPDKINRNDLIRSFEII